MKGGVGSPLPAPDPGTPSLHPCSLLKAHPSFWPGRYLFYLTPVFCPGTFSAQTRRSRSCSKQSVFPPPQCPTFSCLLGPQHSEGEQGRVTSRRTRLDKSVSVLSHIHLDPLRTLAEILGCPCSCQCPRESREGIQCPRGQGSHSHPSKNQFLFLRVWHPRASEFEKRGSGREGAWNFVVTFV